MDGLIKKLNKLFKKGYLPSRHNVSYNGQYTKGEQIENLTNCFTHACFNITNEDLKRMNITKENASWIQIRTVLYDDFFLDEEETAKSLFSYVRETGLEVEEDNDNSILKKNEWRVALYFRYPLFDNGDYHFLLQERDGSWTEKVGTSPTVSSLPSLPQKLHGFNGYDLYKTYKITNPYAEAE